MRLTPKNELEYRYRRLQVEMGRAGMDAIILVQNADLFYFTGTVQAGNLYVPISGPPIYLVRRDFLRARMESGLELVLPCAALADLPRAVAEQGCPEPKRVGLELDILPVNLFREYQALYPEATPLDASPLIRRVRMLKSHYEIHILQDAANQADRVCRHAAELIRPGVSEVEVAAELGRIARLEGHQGYLRLRSFNGEIYHSQVISGTDAATPSFRDAPMGGMGLTPAFGMGASYRRLDRNEPVLIDLVSCFDGYAVAQGRMFSIGEPSEKMRRGYHDMLRVESLMMELAEQRISWESIYLACLALAREMGYADSFLGPLGSQATSLGHGTGIECDEYPCLGEGYHDCFLAPGMAFTFAPKLVFPGEGAVGIENTFYVSEEGLKRLTFTDQAITIL